MASHNAASALGQTGQRVPVTEDQVRNNAGGYVFPLDDWKRLDRFLILGSDSNTYYQTAKELTIENAQCVVRCIKADGIRAVNRIVEISDSGRAPKNDAALFALALCMSEKTSPSAEVRRYAADNSGKVARIGTHLFHLHQYLEQLRGWGRIMRRTFRSFYEEHPTERLAYQMAKYWQRDGTSHRDLLRLTHAKPDTEERLLLFKWAALRGSSKEEAKDYKYEGDIPIILGYEAASGKPVPGDPVPDLIVKYRLPFEVLPTTWLNDKAVWEAIFDAGMLMPEALMRNLPKLTNLGIASPGGSRENQILSVFSDTERLKKARLHPFKLLTAMSVYSSGQGVRGGSQWTPNPAIVAVLEAAFYASFNWLEPTGKRILIGQDVSGSMAFLLQQFGNLSVAQAGGAIGMTFLRTEPWASIHGFAGEFRDLGINRDDNLSQVLQKVQLKNFGTTDCALPMLYALKKEIEVDLFIVITDNETWAGNVHPFKALQQYRQQSKIEAKLTVLAMTASNFSIADPSDAGMLDVAGVDANVPEIVSSFAKGEI